MHKSKNRNCVIKIIRNFSIIIDIKFQKLRFLQEKNQLRKLLTRTF